MAATIGTVDAAVSQLRAQLSTAELVTLSETGWDELPQLQAKLGTFVRDYFGLMSKNRVLLATCAADAGLSPWETLDPDGAAAHIVERLWLVLQQHGESATDSDPAQAHHRGLTSCRSQ
jgi:hypothetical protein